MKSVTGGPIFCHSRCREIMAGDCQSTLPSQLVYPSLRFAVWFGMVAVWRAAPGIKRRPNGGGSSAERAVGVAHKLGYACAAAASLRRGLFDDTDIASRHRRGQRSGG